MRVTKLMGLAVTVVALAVTMNALAYKTAQVTNGLTITVETSASARLAVAAPATADPGITTAVTGGKFMLTVADKMQPDSIYTYENALAVTNNDAANAITLTCSASGFDAAVTVAILNSDNTDACTGPGNSIASSTTKQLKLRVTVGSGFAGTLGSAVNGSLVLTGTR